MSPGAGDHRHGDDQTADGLVAWLRSEGATRLRHGRGRTLLDHLIGTYEIVRRWNQPLRLQHAALIHSVYGTDVYHRQLLPVSRRGDVIKVAGGQVERLAYLFSVTPRDLLLAGTHLWAPDVTKPPGGGEETSDQPTPTREELDSLVLLHMANLAEQAQAQDGSPGRWLMRLRELAELLITSDTVLLPLFVAELAVLSDEDESITLRAYCAGVAECSDPGAKANQLALAAAVCSVVAEPCVWQAHLSCCRGDLPMAQSWARLAQRRLIGLGAAWDKRLSYDEWLRLAGRLQEPDRREVLTSAAAIADPRTLFEALVGRESARAAQSESPKPVIPRDADAGRARFQRYLEMLAQADGGGSRGIYPDLESRPWYDPAGFPLASYLQSNFATIRDEILALEPSRFHRESERIARTGDWDVVFLYERGRRRDDVCDACPVTTHGIETHGALRTVAGLIYVSRMRGAAHIGAHRGPTNLRLRCHLGITVPDGDCAIRVGDQVRRWREGECLVFDDYFEHEAWNHTAEDRIVLIVDLWNPDLSPTEVRLLEGLHRYAYAHARQLNRYWSSNAAAASGSVDG